MRTSPLEKHVQQKPPDELLGGKCHLALLAAVGVVTIAERNFSVCHADQAVIGDGHPMGIASQVMKDMLRTAERRFGVHDPVLTE